ncbi:hypothetical protein JL720_16883 [Aureococcus anophagefferens]|nr:hypothetical protein JL720_16883 [Aureococcus anophagefferens]
MPSDYSGDEESNYEPSPTPGDRDNRKEKTLTNMPYDEALELSQRQGLQRPQRVADVRDLFQYIGRYNAHEVELDSTLKCFIPDYIPAVGEMDAFIKVPRPDGGASGWGSRSWTSPRRQSDATVLELQLRAVSKKQHGDVAIRSIEHAAKNPLEIELDQVHRGFAPLKPPPQVNYRKAMPDIDKLMEEWPSEFETDNVHFAAARTAPPQGARERASSGRARASLARRGAPRLILIASLVVATMAL